jgi:hypothetical protein
MVRSAHQDCFDFMVIFRDPAKDYKPTVIFIDVKSSGVNKPVQNSFTPRQYRDTKQYLEQLPGNYSGDVYEMIRKNNYLYIYLTDYEFTNKAIQSPDDHCYITNSNQLRNCLGILFDTYRCARVGSSDFQMENN